MRQFGQSVAVGRLQIEAEQSRRRRGVKSQMLRPYRSLRQERERYKGSQPKQDLNALLFFDTGFVMDALPVGQSSQNDQDQSAQAQPKEGVRVDLPAPTPALLPVGLQPQG